MFDAHDSDATEPSSWPRTAELRWPQIIFIGRQSILGRAADRSAPVFLHVQHVASWMPLDPQVRVDQLMPISPGEDWPGLSTLRAIRPRCNGHTPSQEKSTGPSTGLNQTVHSYTRRGVHAPCLQGHPQIEQFACRTCERASCLFAGPSEKAHPPLLHSHGESSVLSLSSGRTRLEFSCSDGPASSHLPEDPHSCSPQP